jgi:hypothetical protein
VSERFLRNTLILLGTYWLGESLAHLISVTEAGLGAEYSGIGRLGELWIHIRLAAPRTLAAAGGVVLLWLTLGAVAARRWMWALAALFALFGFMNRQVHAIPGVVPDPVSRWLDVAVYCLQPTLGCVAAIWLSARFITAASETPVVESSDVTARGASRALLIVSGVLTLVAGAFLGMWITSTANIHQMSGWTIAAFDSVRRDKYTLAQYREAAYDEAKVALEQFAAYLEGLKPTDSEWQPGEAPLADESGLVFDRMLTYGRLALRAERASRPDEASNYWQRAETYARALKWEHPTRDRIRETITRMDVEQPRMTKTTSQ